MTRPLRVLLASVLLLTAAACTTTAPTPTHTWVVGSVEFRGARGHGTNWAICTCRDDPSQPWREVPIAAAQADSLNTGAPCPPPTAFPPQKGTRP
jgi:hypothetical protein